jgi:hypothetical protein
MSSLVPRLGDALESLGSDRIAGRVPRDVARAVRAEHGAALVRNARIEGRAYVARTALVNTALLSGEEANLVTACPLAESRLKMIVDTYTVWAAGEVGRP